MDGYEEYIGDDFGTLMPGIFTDEPNINTIGGSNLVTRFTPVLFNRFEKEYGYQLQSYLPCLYDEVGDWKNVRHDYQALLLKMFTERWSEPWQKYTDEKKLIWTGHYWEHGWPDPKHGGDNMAMYAYHQYPGIDMLFNSDDIPEQFGNIRAVKELSSVANQLDKARSLSETYGGSGWELTFADMKRQGDWEYVLGVNFMNQHLAHMTLKGARKRDYPQSMSYHTPWWNSYKPLNEYFHRLSFALSGGKQVNNILVLEPTSTGWMLHSTTSRRNPDGTPRPIDQLKDSFHDLLTQFEKNQVEYDLGCESIMKDHGSVKDGKLVIGSRAYDMVIIPQNTQNLMGPTLQLLADYLGQGGKLLSLSPVPERIDGNVTSAAAKLYEQYGTQITMTEAVDAALINDILRSSSFVPEAPESWGGNVFHQRRIFKDGQFYFFTNYHKGETANIAFAGKGNSVAEFDLLGGQYSVLPDESDNGMVSMRFSLLPGESKLLFFGKKSLSGTDSKPYPVGTPKALQASVTTVNKLSPNTLTLDYCDLAVAGKQYKDIYFCNAADTVYKVYLKEKNSPKYNPWSNAVQYRTRILDKNVFDQNTGFEASYHFILNDGFVPSALKAVAESPHLYKISINGQPVQASPGEWWLDKDFGVSDIS
ncbi:MAG: glycosyl hydrolase [Cyclobacteriaceae bacterium]|nr:glycosyl hydrolase [Cyclobacteriaceae bacterium]